MEFENLTTSGRSKRRPFSTMVNLKVNRKTRSFNVQYTSYSDLKRVVGRNELETQKVSRSLSDTRIKKWKTSAPFKRHSVFPDIKYNIDTKHLLRNTRPASVESTHKMALFPRRARTTKGRIYNPPDGLSFNPQSARLAYCRLEQRNDEVMKYGARIKDTFSQSEYSSRETHLGTFAEPADIDEELVEHGLRPLTREINGADKFIENKSERDSNSSTNTEFYDFQGFRLKNAKPDVWSDIKKKMEREKSQGKEESEDENEDLVGV